MTAPTTWKRRFYASRVIAAQIAPNASSRGVVANNRTGVFQLYAWDVPTGNLRQITRRPEGQVNYLLSPDGRYVYYLNDEKGDEIGHFARFPYKSTLEDGPIEDMTPDLPLYSPAGVALSRSGNTFGVIAGGGDGFRLFLVSLNKDGSYDKPREVFYSEPLLFGVALSYNGDMAVLLSTERSRKPEFNLVAIETATGEIIGELWDGEGTSVELIFFSPVPGDPRLLARSNRTGFEKLLIWNPHTGERTDLDFEGVEGSTLATDWSDDGKRILFQTFNQAVKQYYTYDLESGVLAKLAHPPGTISGAFFAPVGLSGGEIFGELDDAANPTRVVVLDDATGEYIRDALSAGKVPSGHAWRSVQFPSSDGQMVQGWLATPAETGVFPTIMDIVGGPGGVQPNTYHPQSQAWVDHGFAFLSVNYRGCATFGKEFENRIFGNPGFWEVEDMVAARKWLVEQGIADPDKVFLSGFSYGGFLTLQGLSLYPDLWVGGIARAAITDWAVQYEDSSDMLRGYLRAFFSGTPQENPEQYAKSSPITYAESVKAPILIIQGKNDTRTPARPVEIYEQKLKSLGNDIEVIWFETGHGGSFMDVELGVRHQERMMEFAMRALAE